MLTDYIRAAMRHAEYEIIEDDGTFFGRIPECPGVWANADTLEACRAELQEVLEDWMTIGIRLGHDFEPIDGAEIIVEIPVSTPA